MSDDRQLVMAYADPPYPGQSKKHYEDHQDYAGEVDHAELVARLVADYPDGWALSTSSPACFQVMALVEAQGLSFYNGDARLMAWVKPFAAFKKNVRVAYAWEPVVVRPAERLRGAIPTRDFVSTPITMKRGLSGAKPMAFGLWLFAAMGLRPTDRLDDLYHGSGAIKEAWMRFASAMEMSA